MILASAPAPLKERLQKYLSPPTGTDTVLKKRKTIAEKNLISVLEQKISKLETDIATLKNQNQTPVLPEEPTFKFTKLTHYEHNIGLRLVPFALMYCRAEDAAVKAVISLFFETKSATTGDITKLKSALRHHRPTLLQALLQAHHESWVSAEEEAQAQKIFSGNPPALAKIDIAKVLSSFLKHSHIAYGHLPTEFKTWCYAIAASGKDPTEKHAKLFRSVEDFEFITENLINNIDFLTTAKNKCIVGSR